MKRAIWLQILVLFQLSFNTFTAFSQEEVNGMIKDKLPKIMTSSSMGTDFWFTVPPCFEDEDKTYNNVYVLVTGPVSALVTVEVYNRGFTLQKKMQANTIAEFKLEAIIALPWRKTGSQKPPEEDKVIHGGIHVCSDASVTVYCIVRFQYTSDGFLVLPTSSLGNEYIVSSYGSMDALTTNIMPSLSGCCATEDSTIVSFTLGGNSYTKTASGLKTGDKKRFELRQGDVVMIASDGDGQDLTGSVWKANKPIAVVSGNYCANIPIENRWCDYTCEMDLPTYTWGTSYHVPKIHGRKYPSIIRIFAKEPNTTIYRDGDSVFKLTKANGKQNVGWYEMRMVPMDEAPKSVVITADKPIGITLCNTSVQEDLSPMPDSDPFQMAILPDDAFNREISFSIPCNIDANTFKENYINLVYETDRDDGQTPEGLKFGTIQDGKFIYSSLRELYPGPDEVFYNNNTGKKYAVKHFSLNSTACCKIIGDKPFAAYAYGYGNCDSYGYPVGIPWNAIGNDNMPPDPVWSMECNGNVINASVKDMPANNGRSGLSSITLD